MPERFSGHNNMKKLKDIIKEAFPPAGGVPLGGKAYVAQDPQAQWRNNVGNQLPSDPIETALNVLEYLREDIKFFEEDLKKQSLAKLHNPNTFGDLGSRVDHGIYRIEMRAEQLKKLFSKKKEEL